MSTTEQPLFFQYATIQSQNKGKISFGPGCIVHPYAKIIVEGDCSIVFGEYNIIEENVIIKSAPRYSALLNNEETITVYIGNYNHFKVGAYLENTSVENFCTFDYGCHLEDSYIESKSIISAGVTLPKRETVKQLSIVFDHQSPLTNSLFNEEKFKSMITDLQKLLAKLLPKNNRPINLQ
jgi:carbonic anhydrase/acetyltransferase-like protein (isoleucine patch superfamily)